MEKNNKKSNGTKKDDCEVFNKALRSSGILVPESETRCNHLITFMAKRLMICHKNLKALTLCLPLNLQLNFCLLLNL